MEREKLKSRLGFILLSAGCAIGIGNVWKFPYMAGQGGGGAFVLFYLLFLVILGLPIMTMEFAVGRASHKSPVRAYQALEKPGQKWHIHGYFTLIGCYLLMMFYTTVAGWMLHYFYMTAAGKLVSLDADQVAGKFTEMLASPLTMGFWMVVVVAIGIFVCARGLQNGLEKVTKVMMIALLVIMVVLAVNSMFMPGAKEGLTFFLVPDFERMKEVGIVNTLVGAMNQAFFTLSLGIGAMAIFGSYIGKEHSLLGESARIVVLDTFVAITAGLIIFPACFTYGVDQTSGPSLIFCACGEEDGGVALDRLKQRLGRRLGLVPGDEERAHARVDRHARHAGNGLEHARDLPARLGLQAVKHGMAQARASRQQASHAVANVCHVCLLMRRPWLRARSRQRAERRRPPNRRRGSRRPGG